MSLTLPIWGIIGLMFFILNVKIINSCYNPFYDRHGFVSGSKHRNGESINDIP